MTRPSFTLASPIDGGGGPRKWGRGAFGREGSQGSKGVGGSAASLYKTFTTGLRLWEKRQTALTGEGNAHPLWWLAPPPFSTGKRLTWFSGRYCSPTNQVRLPPRSSVGRQKESALMDRLGALFRPTVHILCRMCTVDNKALINFSFISHSNLNTGCCAPAQPLLFR